MLVWIVFLVFIFVLLALDLGVFHRHAHVVSVREALKWTVIWILTALASPSSCTSATTITGSGWGSSRTSSIAAPPTLTDASTMRASAVLKFVTGYVVELSLSADNVFVIAMLFSYFAIPRMYQHRVLFWGILGALVMRGAMIAVGAKLVAEFSWILSVFGAVLILTAIKMALMGIEPGDPSKNVIVRLMRRFLPVTDRFDGEHFFVRAREDDRPVAPTPDEGPRTAAAVSPARQRGWMLTPLVPALVMVETTDLVFAIDSIPAIFAITADPFLVFTSNVFAILGLRSLYFALAGALHLFRYLKHALALVLLTVGIKMLAHTWLERVLGPDFNLYLLATVLVILGAGVVVSLIEVRWGDPIGRAIRTTLRTLQEWIVPDRLTSTILRAGRREIARRTAAEARHHARRSVTRPAPVGFWNRLFRGKRNSLPILVVHQIIEEGGMLAALL